MKLAILIATLVALVGCTSTKGGSLYILAQRHCAPEYRQIITIHQNKVVGVYLHIDEDDSDHESRTADIANYVVTNRVDAVVPIFSQEPECDVEKYEDETVKKLSTRYESYQESRRWGFRPRERQGRTHKVRNKPAHIP